MKYIRKRIISMLVCVGILLGLIAQSGGVSALATSLNNGTIKGNGIVYKLNPQAELGTEDNPFVVLEIVPTLDQAQFGYFIPGCEPIDMDKVIRNLNKVDWVFTGETLNGVFSVQEEDIYSFYEDIPQNTPYNIYINVNQGKEYKKAYCSTDFENGYLSYAPSSGEKNCWTIDSTKKVAGYFQKTESGKGNFSVYNTDWYPCNEIPWYYLDSLNCKSGKLYMKYTPGEGDYIWTTTDEVADNSSDKIWMERNDYFVCHSKQFVNNDILIKAVFDQDSYSEANPNGFRSKVVTVTPTMLSNNIDLIDEADLIYLHDGRACEGLVKVYNFFNNDNVAYEEASNTITRFSDADCDLTCEEALKIVRRMNSSNPAALIMDMCSLWADGVPGQSKYEQYKELNSYKLTLMTLMYEPSYFCEIFVDNISEYNRKLYYEYAKTDELKMAWTNETFRFDSADVDVSSNARYWNINSGGHNIFDKIYTYQGDKSLLQELSVGGAISESWDSKNQNSAAFDYYESISGSRPVSITNMEAVKFILQQMSYTYTPKLRILEIEPCDQYIYGSVGWKEYYQSLFPWYHPQSGEASWLDDENLIEVTTMPTWEFIGSTGQYDYDAKDANGNWKRLSTESSDDLIAKYDLIIIGSKQDASNGLNGYNQYSNAHDNTNVDLGKLVYTSIGGTLYNGNAAKHGNKSQYSEQLDLRYSGNDITLKKLLELEDFLKAGKPIVVDEGLYSGGVVNTAKVDCGSKLYDLLTWKDTETLSDGSARNAHENIFIHGSIPTAKMKSLISENSCRIEFYEAGYPVEYGYTTYEDINNKPMSYTYDGKTATAEGVIVNEIYQGKNSNGTATLTYHFYIAGNASDTYNAFLHIDLDGDGVYAGSLKEHSEVDNMNVAMGYSGTEKEYAYDTTEQALGLTIYDADHNKLGVTKPNGENSVILYANTEYYATRDIPSSQQGIIPWKLEVQSCSNPYLRSSAIDYTAVYNKDNREKIMVLQMDLQSNMNSENLVEKDLWGHVNAFTAFTKDSILVKPGETYQDFEDRRISNKGIPETDDKLYKQMSENQKRTVAKFETYLDPVQEFDVTIQFMFNKDWYQLFGVTADSGEKYEQALANWKAFLSEYDMLVFGFVDQSCFTGDTVFAEGVKDYIAQGKSLILSHDTISGTDLKTMSQVSNAYTKYNPWLRTISGQRRSYYNKQSDGTYEKSYSEIQVNGSTVTFASSDATSDSTLEQFFSKVAEDIVWDSADKLGSYLNEWPDNSTFLSIYELNWHKDDSIPVNTERVSKSGTLRTDSWANNNSTNTAYVELTNNGQITSYPYKLNSVIQVLKTHTQYYQLDLEYMEDGDVNVWFNLSDTKDPEVIAFYNGKVPTSGITSSTVNIYSSRDQDCRNSFYIYNKGNITYTGSGHGVGIGNEKDPANNALMTDDEVKLFVNTMISAYRQPESEPFVQIDNADANASDGTNILYLDYDGYQYELEDGTAGAVKNGIDNRIVTIDGKEMVAVEFSIYDLSSTNVNGKNNYMWIYQEGEPIDVSHVIVRSIKKSSVGDVSEEDVTYSIDDAGVVRYNVSASVDGESYVMYVPYEDITENGAVNYCIGTYATYIKSNKQITTSTSTTNATVMLLPLFDLN